MKLLLDTHIWIWALQSPAKLNQRVSRELQRRGNDLYLSPISIWEAHYLERRRRIRIKGRFSEWINAALTKVPFKETPLSFAIATTATQIELPQAGPGDLFLAATAITMDLTLVTGDEQLLACAWLKTLSNN